MDRFFGPAFDAENEAQLTLLLLPTSLEALDLISGEVDVVREGPSRPLPDATAFFAGEVRSGGFEWSALDGLPDRLESLRIEATAPAACVDQGGCYRDEAGAAALRCVRPCPAEVEFDPAIPIDPPVQPELTWTPPARIACQGDEVQWVGAEECAPLAPCPAGPFAEDLPAGALLVDPTAGPYLTIADALIAAQPGDTIALSKGTHAAGVVLDGISLHGACPAETEVMGRIDVQGSLRIEGVALRGGSAAALVIASGADLTLERALIEGTGPVSSIDVTRARVTGRQVVVRSSTGRAFETHTGVTLALTDSVVAAGGGLLYSLEPTALSLESTVVEKSAATGLSAAGTLTLRRALFVENAYFSVETFIGTASLVDVVVRDAGGISLQSTTSSMARVLIERATERGLQLVGGEADASDLVIRDLVPAQLHVTSVPGISVFGATVTLKRARIERTHGRAIEVSNTGQRFEASDVWISEVGDSEQGNVNTQGFGVTLFEAESTFERLEVANVVTTGVFVSGGRTTLKQVFVHGSDLGNGIGVVDADRFELERAIVEESGESGIVIEGSSTAFLDTVSSSFADAGASFGGGARVEANRLRIADARSLGICLRDQVEVDFTGLVIERVVAESSIECTITTPPPGTGLLLNGQPRVTLSNFRLTDNQGIGMLVNRDATTAISDGEVRGSFVGAQLDPEVDPTAVMVRVLYDDNVSNVEVY